MTASIERDLIVVSDLHLGRGRAARTGRYHALETFFFDEDFQDFCGWLLAEAEARRVPFTLLFNGDTFDLLRIEPEPSGPEAGRRERRFGAPVTPEVAAGILASILAGHPVWVQAVARVLSAGHRVVFLPGNHDVELQWEAVRGAVREALGAELRRSLGEARAAGALERLEFRPWFYHEPGRIWVEHGNQYDPECAFRYSLRGGGDSALWTADALECDLPLGNFFQRYLYNAFGSVTFIVPSTRANRRYLRWLIWNRPGLLVRVLASHGPFMLQLLRRVAMAPAGRPGALEAAQRAQLEALAHESGLGATLHQVDALKHVPGNLARAASAVVSELARLATFTLALGLGAAGLWFAAFAAIQQMEGGVGQKTLLFLGVQLLGATLLVAAGGWRLLRTPRLRPPRPMLRGAERLARLLGVRVVTFGHSHEEVVAPLGAGREGEALYFNTGTWISTFTHEPLLPRERAQCTFLRMRGERAELLHWSPARRRPLPVVLFEEEEHPREGAGEAHPQPVPGAPAAAPSGRSEAA